jgi:acyl-CoA hydrolase
VPDLLDTYIENRWIVQPNHANTLGTAHGGTVLKWMDEVGVLSAMRFAGESCATARMDRVSFERPVEVGDTALVESYVYDTGRTSMRVRLRAFRENPRTGERELTTESYVVYVAIDEDHEPTPVPDLTVDSERGRDLRAAARGGED